VKDGRVAEDIEFSQQPGLSFLYTDVWGKLSFGGEQGDQTCSGKQLKRELQEL